MRSTTPRDVLPARPGLVSFLRAVVLASAAAILCWPLTVTSGVTLAILGALVGALAADMASRTPLKLSGALAICSVILLVGTWIARLAVKTDLVAGTLGPVAALWVSEAALWFVLITPTVFALRFLAARKKVLTILEVLAVATALVISLAAHREGMVNRPLVLGDWAWTRGLDPVLLLLVLGVLVTLLLAALMVSDERRRKLPLHFGMLGALALLLLLVIRLTGPPVPDPAGGLGLTGESEDSDDSGKDPSDGDSGGSSSEPSDQMGDLQFRNEYQSNGNQAPVAVVLLHDDYSPPPGVYYFRQSAFSQYNGRRLVQATRDDVDRDVVPRFPAKPILVPDAPEVSDRRRDLKTSMGLLVDHVRPFALDSPAALRPIRNPDPMRFQRAFEVLSRVQTLPYQEMIGQRPGDRHWTDEQWDHYTEGPSDPRYRELTDRIMSILRDEYRDDPLAQALAIKAYLDEKGIYSRRSQHADSSDPTASFLFGDLTGYCVHFAHAAAYMMRTRGIPARVAAGYAVAEAARGSGSTIMVRGADAHAWPEIYLEDVGWVVIDPAPEQTLDEPVGPPDQRLQSMLGEMMRQELSDEMDFEESSPIDWRRLKLFLVAALLALLAAAYSVKFYRALSPYFSRPLQRYRVAYRAALDRLAEVGLKRKFGESRESFAERARAAAPSFAELTGEHLRWALGSAEGRGDPDRFSRLMVGVESELRRSSPRWRRMLGFLNPLSWLMAR